MAALAITSANVFPGTTADAYGAAQIQRGIAGTAVGLGVAIYVKPSDGLVYPADSNAGSTAAAASGISLNSATVSQPIQYINGGPLSMSGCGLSTGVIYVAGATAGEINPAADMTSSWFSTRLGWAYSSTILVVDIKVSGVALV